VYALIGSLRGAGGRKMPWLLTRPIVDWRSMAPRMVRYDAPGWGVGELWLDGDLLLWAEHPRQGREPAAGRPVREADQGRGFRGNREVPPAARELAARFTAYFAGEEVSFDDVEVDLDGETPFGLALAAALRAVPRGEVVSYGELAGLAGRRRAARAAGSFCARSRFAIVIPCHRVVGAEGLGSYGSLGLDYKRRLLALEGYELPSR
jgi:methylated-DNA-[protein]-cysteine S-methyltransferase